MFLIFFIWNWDLVSFFILNWNFLFVLKEICKVSFHFWFLETHFIFIFQIVERWVGNVLIYLYFFLYQSILIICKHVFLTAISFINNLFDFLISFLYHLFLILQILLPNFWTWFQTFFKQLKFSFLSLRFFIFYNFFH